MGNYPYWRGKIRPFYDRLDIEVPVIFYQVPETNPLLGPTVFTDRFWDDRDRWINFGVGTVSGSLKVQNTVKPQHCGFIDCDPLDFIRGISYERWLAGEYHSTQHGCCDKESNGGFQWGGEGDWYIPSGFAWGGESPFFQTYYSEGGFQWGGEGILAPGFASEGGFQWGGEGRFSMHIMDSEGGFEWGGEGISAPGFASEGGFEWGGEGDFP